MRRTVAVVSGRTMVTRQWVDRVGSRKRRFRSYSADASVSVPEGMDGYKPALPPKPGDRRMMSAGARPARRRAVMVRMGASMWVKNFL